MGLLAAGSLASAAAPTFTGLALGALYALAAVPHLLAAVSDALRSRGSRTVLSPPHPR